LKHLGDQVKDLRNLSLGSQPQNGAADGGSIGSYCEVAPERLASDIFPIGALTSFVDPAFERYMYRCWFGRKRTELPDNQVFVVKL